MFSILNLFSLTILNQSSITSVIPEEKAQTIAAAAQVGRSLKELSTIVSNTPALLPLPTVGEVEKWFTVTANHPVLPPLPTGNKQATLAVIT